MKITLLSVIMASVVLVGCQNKKTDEGLPTPEQKLQAERNLKYKAKQDSIATKLASVKDIEDYRLAFLHSDIDKAVTILGDPDDKMVSIKGGNGVYIWYDRTKRNKTIVNLVIEFLHYEVRQVLPVRDNATFYSSRAEPVQFLRKQTDNITQSNNITQPVDIDVAVKEIRKKFYSINYKKLNAESISANEKFQDDLTTVYTNANKEVVKIMTEMRAASIESAVEYYFSNNKLYFIYQHQSGTNTTEPYECRTYIYKDETIKIVENKVDKICKKDCNFNSQSEPYILLKNYYDFKAH